MNTVHPTSYQVVIPFGKFKGMTFGYIAEAHRSYLEWLSGQIGIPVKYQIAAARTLLGEALEVPPNAPVNPVIKLAPPKSSPPTQTVRIWQVGPSTSAVEFPFSESVKNQFKETVDGHKWNMEDRHWEFPSVQLERAVGFFQKSFKLNVAPESQQFIAEEKQRRIDLDNIRKMPDADIKIKLNLPLRGYQNVAVKFAERAGYRIIIADQPGIGKTATGIGIAEYTHAKTLIICPKSVKNSVWEREIKRFTGKNACVWEGAGYVGSLNAQYHIINYDIIAKFIVELRALKFDLLIADEATYLKNYQSIRAKTVFGKWNERKKFPGLKTKWVIFLTGTPILNRPMEAYTLFSFIDKKRFSNPKHFMARYGVKNDEAKNLDELHDRFQDLVIRRLKTDVLKELPPKQRNELYAEMTPSETKAYNKLVDDVLGYWSNTGVPSAADMPKIRNFLFEMKFPRIIEFIDEMLESGRPVLTFSIQQAHAERIAEHYGSRARLLHGGISGKRRQEVIDDLSSGKATVGAFTINAGGMGIDGLQKSMSDVLFTDFWWVPAVHEQAEDRVSRSGQKNATTAWYMVVENTMDEIMRDILAEKQKVIDAAVDGKLLERARSESIFKEVVGRMAKQRKVALKLDRVRDEDLSE